MMNAQPDYPEYRASEPLGIIAGAGALPRQLIEARTAEGGEVFVIAIKGQTPESITDGVAHAWCRIGSVGKAMEVLKAQHISQLVMAGTIKRPSLTSVMPDGKGRALLRHLGGALISGDDALLSKIIAFFETEGFRIVAPHQVSASLLAEEGVMTKKKPSTQARENMLSGRALLHALSPFDVGQAVVVAGGHIIGIEAAEGTAALLRRCADYPLCTDAVLVKMPKAGQSLRVDMPAVGIDTTEALHEGGYAGMFLAAGGCMMLGKDAMIEQANHYSMFIEGITHDETV